MTSKGQATSARPSIEPPADFVKALRAAPAVWARWQELSDSHQREHVEAIEEAKRPETRVRRIARAVEMIALMPPRKRPLTASASATPRRR